MSQYKIAFDSIAWEAPMAGLRFKAGKQGGKQLRLVEYTSDMEPHWCEKGHVGYVLEGQFEIRFEGQAIIFNAGDGVFIPPGAEHKHMGRSITDGVRAVFVEET